MFQSGARIGDWVVDAPLGEGGMGAVYRVHSALVERLTAALKVMKPTEETDGRARFVREAGALSALNHPAIVRVMGFGEDHALGVLYLAMELVEGETLAVRLERGPLPLSDVLSVFVPLASALEHAHQAGIFHRDIKPSNIILCRAGFVRLVDFGIALEIHGGETITTTHRGTLSYLPPELFRGETPDPGCMDVYALGLVLHEALTGARPFRVEGAMTPAAVAGVIAARKLESAPLDPGPSFPDALRDVVRATTQGDPRARPSSAQAHAALREIGATGAPMPSVVAAAPLTVTPDRTQIVPDLPRRTPRALYAVVAAMVPVVVAAVLIFGRGRGDPSQGRRGARPVETVAPATPAPVARASPSDRAVEGDGTVAPDDRADGDPAGVDGRWEVDNEIEASSHPAYRGLRLGYEITLRHQGRRVSGEGHKVSENGAPLPIPRRTPILVTGMRHGRDVSLTFMERGAERNTAGTLEWRLSADGRSVSGSFVSDAAGSRGSSTARRVGDPGGVPRREN